MSKWVIFAGLAVASVLLFQFNGEEFASDDIFQVMEMAEEEKVTIGGDEDFTIMAFGDIMLGRYVRILMDTYGKDYLFEDVSHLFAGVDVVFGNFEGPINGEGKKGGTSMNFAFNQDVAPFLKESGFDILTIANNHSLDQGWEGRTNTIEAFDDTGLGWCGHPTEPDYDSVFYGQSGDNTFAFVCFNDVGSNLDEEGAVTLIEDVSKKVDYTIVTIHWGIEYRHYPDKGLQVEPGHAFADAGADFVIGHHPHVVQSFEIYNDTPIFYSLGNFIFDQYWSVATQEELALGIVFLEERIWIYLYPMKSEQSQPRLLSDEEYDVWIEKFINYSDYDEDMKEQIRSGVIVINL